MNGLKSLTRKGREEKMKAIRSHIKMYATLAEKYKKYDDDTYEVRDGKLYRRLIKLAKRKLFWLHWPFVLLRRLCYNQ